LSFQPDGAISFGLNDRTYIAPKFKAESMVWNAYNRIGIEYVVAHDHSSLEPVRNPHFTYHPALVFQLKDEAAPGRDFLFRGIADVGITLEQEGTMPWIRATSGRLADLPVGGKRADGIAVTELTVVADVEDVSVRMAIDFVRPGDVREVTPPGVWDTSWKEVGLRLVVSTCAPQLPTLSWFYFS
jgi:hypothetical protein